MMDSKTNLIFISFIFLVFSYSLLSQQVDSIKDEDRLPPGQKAITDFPLLHIGDIPDLNRENWILNVSGKVKNPLKLSWDEFIDIGPVESVSDFHCVTRWSRLNNHWQGVRIRDILVKAIPLESARHITFKSKDGYTTSLPISECTGDDDILAFHWEGKDLGKDMGGPVRVVIPSKYGYKSALWVVELKLTEKQELGYWEKRGYSNSADPWLEERYAE
jgi:DMSO/TMAO reductase YedYZ molybdopterin-dependent catalytic subunit